MPEAIPFPRPRPEAATLSEMADDASAGITRLEEPKHEEVWENAFKSVGLGAKAGAPSPQAADPFEAAFKSVGLSSKQPEPQTPPTEQDGFWNMVGKSALRGAIESAADLAQGVKAATTSSVADQAAEGAMVDATKPPDPRDEVGRLTRQPISVGWD